MNLIKGEVTHSRLAKLAYNLHKSIKPPDLSEFKFALSMFPNKIRPESDSVLHGERKIVTLIKEQIIRQIPTTESEYKSEILTFYRDIKKKASDKKVLKKRGKPSDDSSKMSSQNR